MAGELSFSEIAKHALEAGWTGNDAKVAVAIAMAESGGNPRATNFVGRDLSFGLWQINMLGAMGPARRTKYGLKANEDLFDPGTNAKVAYGIWAEAGKKFTPWSVYLNKRYMIYVAGADFGIREVQNKPLNYAKPTIGGITNPLDAITADFGDIKEFVTNRDNWLRLAAVLGGGVLIILAVLLILTDTLVGQLIRKASKASKMVKTAKGVVT
jgi:hypothetical protein